MKFSDILQWYICIQIHTCTCKPSLEKDVQKQKNKKTKTKQKQTKQKTSAINSYSYPNLLLSAAVPSVLIGEQAE